MVGCRYGFTRSHRPLNGLVMPPLTDGRFARSIDSRCLLIACLPRDMLIKDHPPPAPPTRREAPLVPRGGAATWLGLARPRSVQLPIRGSVSQPLPDGYSTFHPG